MKKSLLSLLLLSSLPLIAPTMNIVQNHETSIVSAPIKKAATNIPEQYYLSQNPTDSNRPYEFEKAATTSQMVSQYITKGSIEYTFYSNYIGYTYSFDGNIQINYRKDDSFWNASATYTLVYRGTMSFSKEDKYISVLSETKDSLGITTLRFCLINLPANDIKLFKFSQNEGNGTTVEKYNAAIDKYNAAIAQGTNHLTTREIISFKRDQSYTIEDGGEATVYANVDDKLTLQQILSNVSARDLFGADVSLSIGENDYNAEKVGTYRIPVTATDSYDQTASATIIVVVDDFVAPVITTTNVTLNSGSTISFDLFKSKLEVTDNYYEAKDITLTCVETTAGFDWDKTLSYGNYAVTVKATDKSNRSQDYIISVKVNDALAPVIKDLSGNVPTFSQPIKIGLSALNSDINAQILSLFKVEDDHDIGLRPTIKQGTVERKVGTYPIILQVDDTAGNHSELAVKIEVFADKAPVFILNPLFAISSPDNPLSADDIQDLIVNSLPENYSMLEVDQNDIDSYLQNSNIEGDNTIHFSYNDQDLKRKNTVLVISVSRAPFETATNNSIFSNIFNSWNLLFNNINQMNLTNWITILLSLVFIVGIAALAYLGVKKIISNKQKKELAEDDDEN